MIERSKFYQSTCIQYNGVGWVVAHKILVSAPVPLELILTGLGLGLGGLGFGTGLDNNLAVLNISFYKNNEDFSLNKYLKQHFSQKDNTT